MAEYRYRQGCYCYGCKKEIEDFSVCSKCGNSFMQDYTPNGGINPFATLRDIWVDELAKWWNPLSWNGGYWKFDGLGKKEE